MFCPATRPSHNTQQRRITFFGIPTGEKIKIRACYSSVAGVFARPLCLHTTHSNGVVLLVGRPTGAKRLVSKHGIKMKACVAVQRKLLEMIYVIWKSGAEYDRNYFQKDKEQVIAA